MARLSVREIEKLIYPVSFYRNKAEHVKACCEMLLSRFGGRVPDTMEELILLPGVGRKTANLVLILAFKSQREHLRGHARAPHLEPDGMGEDVAARRNGAGAVQGDRAAVVALHQPVPGDLGPERVPAGVPAMRRLRDRGRLSKNWVSTARRPSR